MQYAQPTTQVLVSAMYWVFEQESNHYSKFQVTNTMMGVEKKSSRDVNYSDIYTVSCLD